MANTSSPACRNYRENAGIIMRVQRVQRYLEVEEVIVRVETAS